MKYRLDGVATYDDWFDYIVEADNIEEARDKAIQLVERESHHNLQCVIFGNIKEIADDPR